MAGEQSVPLRAGTSRAPEQCQDAARAKRIESPHRMRQRWRDEPIVGAGMDSIRNQGCRLVVVRRAGLVAALGVSRRADRLSGSQRPARRRFARWVL